MEIFLLLLDELDDATAALRMRLPQFISLVLASGLFAVSIWAIMRWQGLAAGALLIALLLAYMPLLRFNPLFRVKSDF